MGLSHGKYEETPTRTNNNDISITFDPKQPPPEITEEQIRIIRETWDRVSIDVARVGVITFLSLFETHPEVHDAFMSFRAIDTTELEFNHILRKHALRVMGTVDKCIYRLDNRDKIRDLMTELGIRHKTYTKKIDLIDLMGPQFISSMKPHLTDVWTPEHQDAWESLFKVMCYYMKKGICSI